MTWKRRCRLPLELRLGDGWSPAAAYGEAPPQVVAFPLTFQRETVGRLLVGTRSRGDQLGPDDEQTIMAYAKRYLEYKESYLRERT